MSRKLAFALLFSLIALPCIALAQEAPPPDPNVDPAPSGNEQTIISENGTSVMGQPGADSGTQTRDGNTIKIDFTTDSDIDRSTRAEDLNPDTTTIEHETPSNDSGDSGDTGDTGTEPSNDASEE